MLNPMRYTHHGIVIAQSSGMKTLLLFAFLLCGVLAQAQPIATSNSKQIAVRNAESLIGDQRLGYQRLLGNVQFEHQGTLMYCDSAHLRSQGNTLEAYGHVHIQQGDSVHIYGDLLKYDGNSRIANMRRNVRLTDRDMVLTTDSAAYDMNSKIARYVSGAKIVSRENTLNSQIGTYSTETKTLTFKKNVVLNNPRYVMNCDTLRYQPDTKVAYFLGPTTIKSKGSTDFIYCENGFYDTKRDVCQFRQNAYIITESQELRGDSLWYDRRNGLGKAIGHVKLTDTTQNIVITGGLATHNERTNTSVVTKEALFIQIFDKDSLFLHADTLKTITVDPPKDDTISEKERKVYAYRGVRFFKTDLQGRCDSLSWTSADSTMRLFGDPVLWSGGNQLTAERVYIITVKGEVKRLELENLAFIASRDDSARFNQIRGKHMTGYFQDNELVRIDVRGNGQTLYYARDQGLLVGVNRADCSRLRIEVKDSQVTGISFYEKPEASLFPPLDLPPRQALLKDFKWREKEQPMSVADLFVK
jgi:lipopolysaccharide export system protein LptA